MNPLNPKKLLLTKWTAVKPIAKQKHFLRSGSAYLNRFTPRDKDTAGGLN